MSIRPKTLIVIAIFSIAMAALESAVVVYLRALYYPDGFTVAFKLIDPRILAVEIARELATLVMLGAIGFLAGKNFRERFACFLLSFAVWDIFYYGWLKVFIDWPASFFEWDILFLIPFTWLGPVLAPVICSVTMIFLAIALLNSSRPVSRTLTVLLISGSALILYTFLKDYGGLMISNGFLNDYANIMENREFIRIASTFLPKTYNWGLFWAGEFLIVLGIVHVLYQTQKERNKISPDGSVDLVSG